MCDLWLSSDHGLDYNVFNVIPNLLSGFIAVFLLIIIEMLEYGSKTSFMSNIVFGWIIIEYKSFTVFVYGIVG